MHRFGGEKRKPQRGRKISEGKIDFSDPRAAEIVGREKERR